MPKSGSSLSERAMLAWLSVVVTFPVFNVFNASARGADFALFNEKNPFRKKSYFVSLGFTLFYLDFSAEFIGMDFLGWDGFRPTSRLTPFIFRSE